VLIVVLLCTLAAGADRGTVVYISGGCCCVHGGVNTVVYISGWGTDRGTVVYISGGSDHRVLLGTWYCCIHREG